MTDKNETKDTPVRISVSLHIPEADPRVASEIRYLLDPVTKKYPRADLTVSLSTVRTRP